MTRKTSTIEIFGKTRMPKALSSETMIAARKVPWYAAEAADHDDDQRLGDHLQVHRMVGRLAAAAQAPRLGRREKRRARRHW